MHHDHLSRCNRKQVWVSRRPIVSNLPGDQDGVGGVGVGRGLGSALGKGLVRGAVCEKPGALPGQQHLELFL